MSGYSGLVGVDLTNSDYWQAEIFETRAVPGTGPDAFKPIPDFELPIFQRSRVMAASFSNPLAAPHWRRGCFIKQCAGIGSIDAGSLADIATWHCPLWHPIIFFPDPSALVWRLRCSVPYWHRQVSVAIYRYTGEIDLPLSTQLKTLDGKLDQLLANP